MLRSPLAALTVFVAANVFAQESPTRNTSTREFLARNPGNWRTVAEPTTQNPGFVYGDRIRIGTPQGSDAGWEAVARQIVNENPELFGLGDEQLRIREIVHLALSRIGSSDKVAVVFDQWVDDLRALGGSVTVLFDARSGDVIALDTTAIPFVDASTLVPALSTSDAVAIAEAEYGAYFGVRAAQIDSLEPYVVGSSPFFGRKSSLVSSGPTLAYAIEASTPGIRTTDNLPMQARVFVSASDGSVLKIVPTAHSIDGKVSGNVNIDPEPSTTTNQETVGLANLRVRQNNATGTVLATTDANGDFTMAQAGPLTLYFELAGPYVRVVNDGGTNASFTISNAVSGSPVNVLFNPAKTEFTSAEVAGFHHVTTFRDWVKSVAPADPTMDFQVLTNVNKTDLLCNAYYDGSSVNLEESSAGSGCANTAYMDVIQHEEGHYANERYNGAALTGAFHEGNADNFAYYINDDSCLTTFFGGSGCLRSALQTSVKKCGTDGDETCNGGAVHTEGQALASAAWAVRTRLNTSLGNVPGDTVANALFISWMQTFNDGAILNVIADHWIALDDDNGDLGDSTPHYADINGGFKDYGWPGIIDLTLTNLTGPADQAEIGDFQPQTIQVKAQSATSSVTSVRVLYSTNGSSYTAIPMTSTGVPNEYSAAIPGFPSPNSISWYVDAANGLGDTVTLPKSATSDTRLFHIGKVVTLQSFNFDGGSDEGWTHVSLSGGTTGDQWQRGNPANSNSSNDPDAAYSASNVWGTDLSATGSDGKYEPSTSGELRSPSFNLSTSAKVRMQYRRFLSVEAGIYDQATIRVNGTTVYSNPSQTNLLDTEWTLHDLDITAQAAGVAAVQIAYRMAADGGVEFGGWNIDDFRLYRVDPNPAGSFQTYGSGCPGSNGTPSITGSGTVVSGSNVTLTLANGKPNATAVLLLGTAQASTPIAVPCTLLVGGILIPTPFALSGTGGLAISGQIPVGTPTSDTFWQFFVSDNGAPNTVYAASNGLKMHTP